MSIYLVKEVIGSQKPDDILGNRGLKAKTTTMSILAPTGLPDYKQPAYDLYRVMLPAFMLATKEKIVLPTSRPGYFLKDSYASCLQVPYPPLAVSFQNKLSAEEEVAIVGRGASIINSDNKGKDVVYTFGSDHVSSELISFLVRHNKKLNDNNFTPIGAINMRGIDVLHRIMVIVTWFLKTHSYPAFSGPVKDEDLGESAFDTIEGFITTKRKGDFASRAGKKAKILEGDDQEDDEENEMEVDVEDYGIEEMTMGDSKSKVPKAKPSTPPASIAGMAPSIPTLPGLSFPYFDSMIDHDAHYVATVIHDFFMECLADTRDGIFANWKLIRSGMSQISKTKTGGILQHLFSGIKLAILTQSRLYPLLEDKKYIGYTLHGWYFTLSIDGYKRVPKSYTELLKEVQLMDEHSIALAKICEFLAKKKLKDTKKKPTLSALKDMRLKMNGVRAVNGIVCDFDLEDDDKLEIEKLANMLSFPQRFWDFSAENITKAIKLLSDGATLPVDEPMFARGGVITSMDKHLDIFSAFGEMAFSFRVAGGEHKLIPKDVASDVLFKPYKGKNDKTITPAPSLIVAKKNLTVCVADWIALEQDHKVHLKKSRDSPFRNAVFSGKKAKEIWYSLIEHVGSVDLVEVVVGSADARELGDEEFDEEEVNFGMFL